MGNLQEVPCGPLQIYSMGSQLLGIERGAANKSRNITFLHGALLDCAETLRSPSPTYHGFGFRKAIGRTVIGAKYPTI